MKIKLTEQQATNLLNKVTGSQLPDIDFEKEAPNLMKLVRTLSNPLSAAVDVGKAAVGKPKTKNSLIKKPPQFAEDIPSGSQMMHPLGHKEPISSMFGQRDTGIPGATKDHKGIDISVRSGSPVYAPLDGVVLDARDTSPNSCGGLIRLDHINMETKFCHLRRINVNVGDKVKKGQVIGNTGGGRGDPMHGNSSGPHLHYEILTKSGVAMNPASVEPNLV